MPALRANTALFLRALTVWVVGGLLKTTIVSPSSLCTVYGVGGLLKTTIVLPSPLDLYAPCRLCRDRCSIVWVVPEEYWFGSGYVFMRHLKDSRCFT